MNARIVIEHLVSQNTAGVGTFTSEAVGVWCKYSAGQTKTEFVNPLAARQFLLTPAVVELPLYVWIFRR